MLKVDGLKKLKLSKFIIWKEKTFFLGRDNRQGVGIEIQVTEEDQDQSPKRIDEEILRGDQGKLLLCKEKLLFLQKQKAQNISRTTGCWIEIGENFRK